MKNKSIKFLIIIFNIIILLSCIIIKKNSNRTISYKFLYDDNGKVITEKNKMIVKNNKTYYLNSQSSTMEGIVKYNNKYYYFSPVDNSLLKNAIIYEDNTFSNTFIYNNKKILYKTNDAGELVKGEVKIGNETLFFGNDFKAITNSFQNERYYNNLGYSVKNKWIYNEKIMVKNVWSKAYNYFGSDGLRYKGWHLMGKKENEATEHWSYFDPKTGGLYTNWNEMGSYEGEKNKHWSYFGPNGWLRTGWQEMGTSTNPDGKNAKHWSYFGPNGWLRTGWQEMGTSTNPDGKNAKHWSYFGPNGWLRTGWQEMGTSTNPDGKNAKHWSYFGPNGWLRTGWQEMGTSTNPDGKNAKHLSYFGSNGWLRTKDTKIGNATYGFNSNGWYNGNVYYSLYKMINQRTTAFGDMGCGGASGLMAFQILGYERNTSYSNFWSSRPHNSNPTKGWNNSSGIWNPAYSDWMNKRSGGKANRIKNVTTASIINALENGQIVVPLVPIGNGNGTHWVTVYGYQNGNFKVADPWGGVYRTYSKATMESMLKTAANRKGKKGYGYETEAVSFGKYQRPS